MAGTRSVVEITFLQFPITDLGRTASEGTKPTPFSIFYTRDFNSMIQSERFTTRI